MLARHSLVAIWSDPTNFVLNYLPCAQVITIHLSLHKNSSISITCGNNAVIIRELLSSHSRLADKLSTERHLSRYHKTYHKLTSNTLARTIELPRLCCRYATHVHVSTLIPYDCISYSWKKHRSQHHCSCPYSHKVDILLAKGVACLSFCHAWPCLAFLEYTTDVPREMRLRFPGLSASLE